MAYGYRSVLVGKYLNVLGHEQMAWYRSHGGQHGCVTDASRHYLVANHPLSLGYKRILSVEQKRRAEPKRIGFTTSAL
jgi:hypothetical protein